MIKKAQKHMHQLANANAECITSGNSAERRTEGTTDKNRVMQLIANYFKYETQYQTHETRQKCLKLLIKMNKSFKTAFNCRDDVRRRLRALSCEKSSIIADPSKIDQIV